RGDHEKLCKRAACSPSCEVFHHQGHFEHAQPTAAMLGRYGDAAEAGVTDSRPDFTGKRFVGVLAAPVVETKGGADLSRRLGYHLLFWRQLEIHIAFSFGTGAVRHP